MRRLLSHCLLLSLAGCGARTVADEYRLDAAVTDAVSVDRPTPTDDRPTPTVDASVVDVEPTLDVIAIDLGIERDRPVPPVDVTPSCPEGLTRCGRVCVSLQTSSEHCGFCEAFCGRNDRCVGGECVVARCDGEAVLCGGRCVDLRTDEANCGGCNRACPSGQNCFDQRCEAPPPDFGGEPFEITEIAPRVCRTASHDTVTGDDRGGIVYGNGSIYVTGDANTGRFDPDVLTPAASLTRRDTLVSDLRTGTVYALGDGANPVENVAGSLSVMVTSLVALGPDLRPTGTVVRLSRPIPLRGGFSGDTQAALYSGYGRVVFHDDRELYHVRLPEGRVETIAFNIALPRTPCENWATWGVAEYAEGDLSLVYVGTGNVIVRYNTRTRARTVVTRFTDLGDACGLAIDPVHGAWFLHYENTAQFSSDLSRNEWLVRCEARVSTGM